MPVHPLAGSLLPVVRWVRSSDGRRYVDVRHTDGHVLRLPVDFTDQALPGRADAGAAGDVRVSVVGLLQLAAAVAARESAEQKLDECGARERSGTHPEQMHRYRAEHSGERDPLRDGHAGADAGGDPGGAERTGDAGPQALVRARPEPGGSR